MKKILKPHLDRSPLKNNRSFYPWAPLKTHCCWGKSKRKTNKKDLHLGQEQETIVGPEFYAGLDSHCYWKKLPHTLCSTQYKFIFS